MYFNAKRADWLRENGCCLEVDFFKKLSEFLTW